LSSRGRKLKRAHDENVEIAEDGDDGVPGEAADRGISRSKIATTGSSTGPQDVFKAILGQTIMRVMPPAMYAIYELNNVELLFVVH
jgi:hypothetical protein